MQLLEHNNLVKLFGIYTQAGTVYISQEICEGRSLKPAQIKEIVIQIGMIHVLEAIQYLHSPAIVHCDIKPESELTYFTWLNVYQLHNLIMATTIDPSSYHSISLPTSTLSDPTPHLSHLLPSVLILVIVVYASLIIICLPRL